MQDGDGVHKSGYYNTFSSLKRCHGALDCLLRFMVSFDGVSSGRFWGAAWRVWRDELPVDGDSI